MSNISLTVRRTWKTFENLVFLVVFCTIIYGLVTTFSTSTWTSLMGKGYVAELTDPMASGEYYKSVLALLSLMTTFFILLELVRLIYSTWDKSGIGESRNARIARIHEE